MPALRLWTAAAAGPVVAAGFYTYEVGSERVVLLLVPAAGHRDRGPATLARPDRSAAFQPWTTGPGIHPSDWLNLLRDAAYQAGQRGRVRTTPTAATSLVQVLRASAQRAAADRPACRWRGANRGSMEIEGSATPDLRECAA
jgi:hypothetical protein